MKSKKKRLWKSGLVLLSIFILIAMGVVIDNMVAQETEKSEETPDENSIEVKLYFLDLEGNTLVPEKRFISKYGNITDQMKLTLIELIRGPQTELVATIPQGVDVREVFLDEKQCAYIDFSRTISQNHAGGTTGEQITIASIVNTMTQTFPKQIRKVRILIDGKEAKTIAGHIDISKPIFPFQ
jgi:spore germination protein GerM